MPRPGSRGIHEGDCSRRQVRPRSTSARGDRGNRHPASRQAEYDREGAITQEDQQTVRNEARRVLAEARDTIRNLTEATNLVDALVKLNEASEMEASMKADKLSAVVDMLLVDLNRCFRTLRKQTDTTNDDGSTSAEPPQ